MAMDEVRKNLNDPRYYNNRELSWLAFNERVLEEAQSEKHLYWKGLNF